MKSKPIKKNKTIDKTTPTEIINKDVANGRIRKVNTIISSRSLNDDKELIDLFFTAM